VPRTREAEQAPPSRPRETEQARPRETAPAEAAPPVRQARPRRTPSAPAQVAGRQAQERAAENLALDYLDAWSESNSAALDLTRDLAAACCSTAAR
jgi:type VI protein secretion system component VasA